MVLYYKLENATTCALTQPAEGHAFSTNKEEWLPKPAKTAKTATNTSMATLYYTV